MTTATTRTARDSRGIADRRPLPEELRELVSHWGAELELAPAEDDHRVGRRDLRRAVLHHLLDGRRGARRPGLQGRARASTWSSSTPATTSSRRSAPATPSPRRSTSTCSRSRPCRAWPSRTRRTARTSTRPTPTCAARCARCSRWPRRSRRYDAWATGLRRAETHNRVIAPVDRLGRQEGQGQGLPARALERRAGRALHRRERRPGQPAGLRRLPVDRLRALHPPGRPGRGRPQRPVGRHQQDRVRHPLMTSHSTRTAQP